MNDTQTPVANPAPEEETTPSPAPEAPSTEEASVSAPEVAATPAA